MNGSAGFNDVGVGRILLETIELGRLTPRKTFDERYLGELVESLKNEGQYKPIIVRLHPLKKGMFEVIDGEHRVRALRKLGRLYVRAEMRVLSDEEAYLLALKINQNHGKRLDELEEGLHIKKLIERHGWSQELIGDRLGRSQQWVSGRLKLARDSCDDLIKAVTTRVVNPTVAREVAELPRLEQPVILARIIKDQLSSRESSLLVRAVKENPNKMEEIITKTINELMHLHDDIKEFEVRSGRERPKFSKVDCPHCNQQLIVNWVLGRITKAPMEDENSE